MTDNLFSAIKKDLLYWVMLLSVSTVLAVVYSKDLLQKFVPRSVVFKDSSLIFLYSVTCIGLFVSLLITSISNFAIYKRTKVTGVHHRGFYWLYALRSLLISFVFAMEFVSVYAAFYWIDIIVRTIALWFSSALAIVLVIYSKEMGNAIQPHEIMELTEQMKILERENQALKKATGEQMAILERENKDLRKQLDKL